MSWEYCLVDAWNMQNKPLEDKFNELGSEGWRLVEKFGYTFIFERQKEKKEVLAG